MKNWKFFKPEVFSENTQNGVNINNLLIRRLADIGITTVDKCCTDGTQTIDEKITANTADIETNTASIEALEDQLGEYTDYRVLLTQAGTAAPTAELLATNTIGTITPAYVSPGVYTLDSAALFTANKSEGWISNNKGVQYNMSITWGSASQYIINTWDGTGAGTLANDLMTDTPVTIRVYA